MVRGDGTDFAYPSGTQLLAGARRLENGATQTRWLVSLKWQLFKLFLLVLLIGLAAWYALSGPLGTPVPALPPPVGGLPLGG